MSTQREVIDLTGDDSNTSLIKRTIDSIEVTKALDDMADEIIAHNNKRVKPTLITDQQELQMEYTKEENFTLKALIVHKNGEIAQLTQNLLNQENAYKALQAKQASLEKYLEELAIYSIWAANNNNKARLTDALRLTSIQLKYFNQGARSNGYRPKHIPVWELLDNLDIPNTVEEYNAKML